MKLNECNDKRVLATEDRFGGSRYVKELRVLEVAPSGNFVKVLHGPGAASWEDNSKWIVIEALDDETDIS